MDPKSEGERENERNVRRRQTWRKGQRAREGQRHSQGTMEMEEMRDRDG